MQPSSHKSPLTYSLLGPEGIPTSPHPSLTLNELVMSAARFMLRYAHQDYYFDTRMERQPLDWVAENLSVCVSSGKLTATQAYTKYVNDNLERIARDGWTPLSYAEFLTSEECDNEMGLEDDMPTADDWIKAGMAAVDSGQMMMCDPCYISSWKKAEDSTERKAPPYRHKDGRILYCGLHGAAPADNSIRFENYDTVIECYGKSMNQMRKDGDVKEEEHVFANPGEFSYEGCCAATDDKSIQGGQLNFEAGWAGAGVVFRTGYGDGYYPVYVRLIDDPEWGRRVAEARIVFIDPDEEDEDDAEGEEEQP